MNEPSGSFPFLASGLQDEKNLFGFKIFSDKLFWLAFFLGGFFLSLTLWYSFGMDQSLFSYGAWVWRTYHLPPYVGVFDQNFPGIFLIHRLVLALFGESILGFRVFDFLIQLSSLGMIFYLAKQLSGSGLAGFLSSVFFGIYYYGLGNFDTGQREGYILWLLLIAIILSLRLETKIWLRAILVGLILGFVFLLKPFYGLSWLVFGLWFLVPGFRQKPARALLSFGLFGLFCLLPAGLVLFYYWRIGYFRELYQATILYNFGSYGRASSAKVIPWWDQPMIVLYTLTYPNSLVLFSGILALLLQLKKQTEKTKKLALILFFLLLVCLISYSLQSKFFPYQLLSLLGLLMIFSGLGWFWLGERFQSQLSVVRSRVFALIFYPGLILFTILTLSPELISFTLRHSFRNLDQAYLGWVNNPLDGHYSGNNYLVAKKLKPLLKPEDQIEYFGPYPLIPFLLKKKLPSRFVCVQHLLFIPSTSEMLVLQKQWITEYTHAVIHSRPRFFLISDYFPGQRHKYFHLETDSLKTALARKFPELQNFLEENYQLLMKEGVIEVYELKERGSLRSK